MPRTVSRVIGITSSSPINPANPRLIPRISQPRSTAERTAARMTALRPGASPPPVEMAILMRALTVGDATGLQQPNDFAGRGVALQFRFLEDRLPLVKHLEPPTAGRGQLDVGIGKSLANLGGQTGRPRFVVSHRAVFDPHAHVATPLGPGCVTIQP